MKKLIFKFQKSRIIKASQITKNYFQKQFLGAATAQLATGHLLLHINLINGC